MSQLEHCNLRKLRWADQICILTPAMVESVSKKNAGEEAENEQKSKR